MFYCVFCVCLLIVIYNILLLLIFLVFYVVFFVLFVFVMRHLYQMLPVSLDCPFLISHSVSINVYSRLLAIVYYCLF